MSKCAAQVSRNREKHFIITRVFQSVPPTRNNLVEIEEVSLRRNFTLAWLDLADCRRWLQGWC